jgi:hypothetical protein
MADTDTGALAAQQLAQLIRQYLPQAQQLQQQAVQQRQQAQAVPQQKAQQRTDAAQRSIAPGFIGPPDPGTYPPLTRYRPDLAPKKGDPAKPAMTKGKKAQVKQYEAEPKPGFAQNLQESVETGGLMGPDQQRRMRIASGQEQWTPQVGKTTAHQQQFYKDQRRLAEQAERGVFGQRLPPAARRAAKMAGALTTGESKLKTGEPLNPAERAMLISAGKIKAPSDPQAESVMAGGLMAVEPEVLGRMGIDEVGSALRARFGRGGTADEAMAATKAGKAVKPPAGEPVGTNVPKNGKTTAAAEEPPKAADDRPPLPKAKEAPAKPASRAARDAQNKRKAAVNDKAEGPGTAPKAKAAKTKAQRAAAGSKEPGGPIRVDKKGEALPNMRQMLDRVDTSLKTDKAAQVAKYRETLPVNKRAAFDKLTPAQKTAYIKKNPST